MTWNNRIVGEGEASPDDLLDHPENWRRHPGVQRDAMRGALDEIGWVQRVVVNQSTGRIIDGHLRVALARQQGDESVPVLWVDLTEEQERVVLATMDTITSLAESDNSTFLSLLESIEVESANLAQLLDTERLRVMGLMDDEEDDDDSEDNSGGGSGSEEYATFEVLLTRDQRRMVEETLSTARQDHGLSTTGEALVALCERYREE